MCFSKTRLKIQLDFGPWFVRSSGESRLAVSSACCPAPWHCLGAVHLMPRGFWKRILRQETENQAAKVDLWQRHVWMTWAVNRLITKCMCIFFFLVVKGNICSPYPGLPLRPKSPIEPKKEGESSTMYSSLPTSDAPENGRQTQVHLSVLTKRFCTTLTRCCHHSCSYLPVYH